MAESRTTTRAPRLLRAPVAWAVFVLGLLLSGILIGVVGQAERTPGPTDDLPEGYGSTEVAELLDELSQAKGSVAVVLFTADEGELGRDQVAELTTLYVDLLPTDSAPGSGSGPGGGPGGGGPGGEGGAGSGRSDHTVQGR